MSNCILAVDTATEICGVALAVDGRVKAELILSHGVTHTRSAMAAVDAVLNLTGTDMEAIDAFAVTKGPGSFTGLRIGISTVKGLSLATGKPIIGISCLEILAHQAPAAAGLICPMIDARRGEIYWTLYTRDGAATASILKEKVGPVAAVADTINGPCHFIGNGVSVYRSSLEPLLEHPAQWAEETLSGLRPKVLAHLAWQRFEAGQLDDAPAFTPVYLRKSDAEINLKGPAGK